MAFDRELESGAITHAGFEAVGGQVTCVLTRFELSSFLGVLWFLRAYRRVRRESRELAPGLLKSSLLFDGLRTCYTLSIWSSDDAIVDLGAVTSHTRAGNGVFSRLARRNSKPQIWSTQWKLWAVSYHLEWAEFDLRSVLSRQTGLPLESIGRRPARMTRAS